ncbi:uncharacterized protein LOC127352627 [Dicentrarchus labrax]|uniref:uncharacterized protein LOC127352627 n=1 Tax=Dicentrarchus labrax TaxID=13489 RepID=UPI0021F5DF26|nr:uncharacterized protein LOC127352627 [Dicentrarchus labrax]
MLWFIFPLMSVCGLQPDSKDTEPKPKAEARIGRDTETKHQQDRERDLLTCQPSPVVAAVGEDVTLDCHLKLRRNVTHKTVEWTFNESELVLVYRSRGFSANQAERFKGRASLDSSGSLSEGKLPVKISSVGKTDAGTYSCSVGTRRERISCSTELIVDTETKHQQDRERDLLTCQPSPVVARVGEDITLDCHLKLRRDVTHKTVEWTFNESELVLLYRSLGFSDNQAERFKGRASLDSSGSLSEGKLPVKISSVGKTDAGTYSCSVGTRRERISCSTELIVDTETKHQQDRAGGTDNQIKNKANPSGPMFALVLVTFTFLYY